METYQMFACTYRTGDPTAAEFAVDAQVSHPYQEGKTLDYRFYFDTLDDLKWLLLWAEQYRSLYPEAREYILSTVASVQRKGLCDISYDDEGSVA